MQNNKDTANEEVIFLVIDSGILVITQSLAITSHTNYNHYQHSILISGSNTNINMHTSNISLTKAISKFVASTSSSTFVPSGTSSKATKRRKQHFQRTSSDLIQELNLLILNLRFCYLYDSGALTPTGANALIVSLKSQNIISKNIVVLSIGQDVIFFLNRYETVRRLSNILKDNKYCPVLINVSPSLQQPQHVHWHETKLNALKKTISLLITSLQSNNPLNKNASHPGHIQFKESALSHMTATVGILLEYPVVYGIFDTDEDAKDGKKEKRFGNCAAADVLFQHRLIWTSGLKTNVVTESDIDIQNKTSASSSSLTRSLLLPWSFTVPQPLQKKMEIRLSISSFFNTIQNRCRQIYTTEGMLAWKIEDMDVSSVCL